MPRGTQYHYVHGTFERNVLGQFNIIRGFATLQTLAEISEPVMLKEDAKGQVSGYQRPLDDTHAQELKRYLEDGEGRFIPEVILSVRAAHVPELMGGQEVGRQYAKDGLFINRVYKSKNIGLHEVSVLKKALPKIRQEGRIRRIDGNHRLALAKQLRVDNGITNQYLVPFCIILLGEPNDVGDDYTEALVFHSINSTPKPLDVEHALKLILNQPFDQRQPAAREFAFNPALHFTRLLHEAFQRSPEPSRSRLGTRPLAALNTAARELLHAYPDRKKDLASLEAYAAELVAALTDLCAQLSASAPEVVEMPYFVELAGHVWMECSGPQHDARCAQARKRLEQMATWLGHDGLKGLQAEKPLGRQLLDIYAQVEKRIPKQVFLARWYPQDEDGREQTKANQRLEQIRETLDQLKREDGLHLDLVDMGTRGATVIPIHQKMYEAITTADIIICDLSGVRPNVCVEAGYALRHHQKDRLMFLFEPSDAHGQVPFDLKTFTYIPLTNATDVKPNLLKEIRAIVAKAERGEI